MMPSQGRNQARPAHFGPLSVHYDRGRKGFPAETIDFIVGRVPSRNSIILDLGCGTGIATRQLSERGFDLIGCDIDSQMIGRAVGRHSRAIAYVVGSASTIPFRSRSFDCVTCFSCFQWFDTGPALDEIRRVLKPAGSIVITRKNGSSDQRRDFRALLGRFVPGPLPDSREQYDPAAALHLHMLPPTARHVVHATEQFPLPEAMSFFRSRSGWNLIDDSQRSAAEDALLAFCRERSADGVFVRDVAVETIVATI